MDWRIYRKYYIRGHLAQFDPDEAYTLKDKFVVSQCFVLSDKSSGYKEYNPLEVSDIFFKFCSAGNNVDGTESGAEQAALAWISKYGMLHDIHNELGQYGVFEDFYKIQATFRPYSIEYFWEQVNEANLALEIYTLFLDEEKAEWGKENDGFYDEFIIPQLNELFDAHLKNMRPCIRHDKDLRGNPKRKIIPDWIFPDLLTMIWWQFYGIVTEQKNIRRCWYCNNWFEPHIEDQKFCPIPEGSTILGENNHSPCANKYYAWLNRQKKKAQKIWTETGDIEMTRGGIAVKHPVDRRTIENWIQRKWS